MFLKLAMKNNNNSIDEVISNTSWQNKDIFFLFYLVVLITFILMVVQYIAYCNGVEIQFTLDNFAKTLNTGITIIGTAEGLRSFTKSSSQCVGESTPVPAYKLKYLLSYILSFILLTAVAIILHTKVSHLEIINEKTQELIRKPDFAYDSMTNGLLSNFICYLIARYGNKISENIDLSDLKFFKKK
jgi:hypothetical protein